jgi:hypothetical protein
MILWRLAQLPGHPYKVCRNCFDHDGEMEVQAELSRSHAVECSGMAEWLQPVIADLKPANYVQQAFPGVNEMDIMLDIVSTIRRYPAKPDTANFEILQQWQESCTQRDEEVSAVWYFAARAIDQICTATMGWQSHHPADLDYEGQFL